MDLGLKNKVVIITGGTKGIGEAISRCVAEEEGIAVFIGRSEKPGKALEDDLKAKKLQGYFIQADLNKTDNCKKIIAEVIEKYGRIDGLVNNAGRNDGVGLENGSPEAFAKSVQENLFHYYEMLYYALAALKESEGSVVNISSKVALSGQGGTSGYAASKGAQLALTREWASELLPYNIRVNAILPAEVMTPLYESWLNTFDNPSAKQKEIEQKIPLGQRMTTAEEIASMAVFLLSNKSAHTTGQFISPDGGYLHLDRSLT
ncbi:SDR family oxidoreductase [Galbibacter sp. EGI 63066]|uniref:SDR family oxidoreductase n=1 Tax=Galbibacter sp. EGI 63066 TaxID=2993559 RepID=UPI002248D5B8|nr:SDR family oxidoreductase [Galbibacter sp. EGI 63066]MCX2679765.1 SDR family oxidoreductase [Galbibacter sp. EGI 63066]